MTESANLSNGLLLHLDAVLLLEFETQRLDNLGAHGSKDTTLADLTVQDLLDSNGARNADELGHGGVALGVTVLGQGGSADFLGTVLVGDAKLVLEHDKIALALLVLHLLLERGTEGVEGVAAGLDLLVGEETDPLETGDDAILLLIVGKLGL